MVLFFYLFVPHVMNEVEWGREMGPRFPFHAADVWELPLKHTACGVFVDG